MADEGNKLHGGPFASTDLGVSAMDKMKIVYAHKGMKIVYSHKGD